MDSTPLEKLRSDIAIRRQTDRQISNAWILIPVADFIYIIASIAYGVYIFFNMMACYLSLPAGTLPSQASACMVGLTSLFSGFSYLQIVSFLIAAGYAYFVFLLVRRRNLHFARVRRLKADLVSVLRDVERARGMNVEDDVAQAEAIVREADANEGEKSAILLTVLVLLWGLPYVSIIGFIAAIYTFYSLQQDWPKHDEREDRFFRWVADACYRLGAPFSLVRTKNMPKRSGALYIVGAIFTLGIVEIWWVYTLINDPRSHLSDHAQLEDNLLSALSGVPSANPAAPPPSPPPSA